MDLARSELIVEAIRYKSLEDAVDAAAQHARRLNTPVTIYTHLDGPKAGVSIGVHGPSERETAFSHPSKDESGSIRYSPAGGFRVLARIGVSGKVIKFKPAPGAEDRAEIEKRAAQATKGLSYGARWRGKGGELTSRGEAAKARRESIGAALKSKEPSPSQRKDVPTLKAISKVGILRNILDKIGSGIRRVIGEQRETKTRRKKPPKFGASPDVQARGLGRVLRPKRSTSALSVSRKRGFKEPGTITRLPYWDEITNRTRQAQGQFLGTDASGRGGSDGVHSGRSTSDLLRMALGDVMSRTSFFPRTIDALWQLYGRGITPGGATQQPPPYRFGAR